MSTCATVLVFPECEEPCGQQATGVVERVCANGHVDDGLECLDCIGVYAWCIQCEDTTGTEVPTKIVSIKPLTQEVQS